MRPLTVNLRHLATREIRLQGSLAPEDLDLNNLDPMIRVAGRIEYELQVEKLNQNLLVRGRLTVGLECQCVRCLKEFPRQIRLEDVVAELSLTGEESVVEGDFVDLTPYVREDIVLAFPQHPLCEPGCVGLTKPPAPGTEAPSGNESPEASPVWAVLNKLEL